MKNRKRIVIIGGGFGGVYTIKGLLKNISPSDPFDLLLISDKNYFLFKPMLQEVATGGLNRHHIVEPLREVFKHPRFRFMRCFVEKVDFVKKEIISKSGKVKYDYLVMAIGAKPRFYGIPGAKENAYDLNNLQDAAILRNRIIDVMEKAAKISDKKKQKMLLSFFICGAGPTGVELAGEMQEFIMQNLKSNYPEIDPNLWQVVMVQRSDRIMPMAHPKCIEQGMKALEKKRVSILLGHDVKEVHKNGITVLDKQSGKRKRLYSETVIWATGVEPQVIATKPSIIKKSGHIAVNEYLEIRGIKNAYALGDCALFFNPGEKRPIPALAQTATLQANYVSHNILADIRKTKKKRCVVNLKGFLVSIGQKFAVAEVGPFRFKGFFAWWLWRTIYLFKLIGLQNKFRVAYEWTLQLFFRRDTTQL